MNSNIGGVLLAIGVLILLIGIATPATTTQTSTTCYNEPLGYGQECIETTYEAPNASRGGLIGMGIFVSIIGIVISRSSSTDTSRNESSSRSKAPTLAEEIEKRQSHQDTGEEKEYSSRRIPSGWRYEINDYDYKNDPIIKMSDGTNQAKFVVRNEKIQPQSKLYQRKYGEDWVGEAKGRLQKEFDKNRI